MPVASQNSRLIALTQYNTRCTGSHNGFKRPVLVRGKTLANKAVPVPPAPKVVVRGDVRPLCAQQNISRAPAARIGVVGRMPWRWALRARLMHVRAACSLVNCTLGACAAEVRHSLQLCPCDALTVHHIGAARCNSSPLHLGCLLVITPAKPKVPYCTRTTQAGAECSSRR